MNESETLPAEKVPELVDKALDVIAPVDEEPQETSVVADEKSADDDKACAGGEDEVTSPTLHSQDKPEEDGYVLRTYNGIIGIFL